MPGFVNEQLGLVSAFYKGLPENDRKKEAEATLRGVFESIGIKELPSNDMEINAEELESIFAKCMEDCGGAQGLAASFFGQTLPRSARALRLALKPIYLAVQASASSKPSTNPAGSERTSQDNLASSAHGVAIGAALASAGRADDVDGSVSEGQRRVNEVASDARQAELMIRLAKEGEVAASGLDEASTRAFLETQRMAQKRHPEIANLLKTAKVPNAPGVCADPVSALGMLRDGGASEALQLLRVEVAKAAERLQELIKDAVVRIEMEPYLAGGESGLLANALYFGNLNEYKEPAKSTPFKVTEAITDRALALFSPAESGAKAKATFDKMSDCIKAAWYWFHPRDEAAEGTLREAYRLASGSCGSKMYHNEALGELFRTYSKLFKQWQSGKRKTMPTLTEAWAGALNNPKLVDVLSGNADRDARVVRAEQLAEEAGKLAAESERRAKDAEKAAASSRGRQHPNPQVPPPSDGGQSANVVQGAARKALQSEIWKLKRYATAAATAAKEAEAANAGDAAEKRQEAVKKQAAVDEAQARYNAKRA